MPPKRKQLEGSSGPDGHAYYADVGGIIHYGAGFRQLCRVTKADKGAGNKELTEEVVVGLIHKHMRKENDTDAGSRLPTEASYVSNEAALVAFPSGLKVDRRVSRVFLSLESDGRLERDHQAERDHTAQRKTAWASANQGALSRALGRPVYEENITVGRVVSTQPWRIGEKPFAMRG